MLGPLEIIHTCLGNRDTSYVYVRHLGPPRDPNQKEAEQLELYSEAIGKAHVPSDDNLRNKPMREEILNLPKCTLLSLNFVLQKSTCEYYG